MTRIFPMCSMRKQSKAQVVFPQCRHFPHDRASDPREWLLQQDPANKMPEFFRISSANAQLEAMRHGKSVAGHFSQPSDFAANSFIRSDGSG